MKKNQISIVIPVYNERESLAELVKRIDKSLKSNIFRGLKSAAFASKGRCSTASIHPRNKLRGFLEAFSNNFTYEYIFVDDGSTDGSFEELKRIKKEVKNTFKIIRFRKNLGKSAALSVGFNKAVGEIIITMDADLQDDPNEIPKLIDKIDKGYDFVIGWRKNRKDPENKIRVSRLFNLIVTRISGLPLHDINCGLKAFKRDVLEEIDLYGELHRFIPLLAANKGFKVTEVPVIHHPRQFGSSKFGPERLLHAFFDLITTIFLTSFKNRPLQIFGLAGLICITLGLIVLIYLSYLHFLGQTIGRRPLLFLGILLILFGVQIFSTGLLGELIVNIHANNEKYPISEEID